MTENVATLKILAMFMLESDFKREPNIKIDGSEKFESKLEIRAGEGGENNQIFSELTVSARIRYNDEVQAEAKVKIVGVFLTGNMSPEDKKNYAFVNCPAIIFPFVREHITSLFVKAGMKAYMLDAVNFVDMYRQQKPIPTSEITT